MPKVREAIKLIEADGWRKVTTKGSHRQVKYLRRTAQPLTRPCRESYPGRFWLMGEALPTIFRRKPENLVYLRSTSTIPPTFSRSHLSQRGLCPNVIWDHHLEAP